MYFSTYTQSIWIDYIDNNTKEQEKEETQCQSARSKIHYANFFAATACSKWKLHTATM